MAKRWHRLLGLLSAVLLLGVSTGSPARGGAAPAAPCVAVEGASLGPIRIGMTVPNALKAAGRPVGQVNRREETIYLFAGQAVVSQINATKNRVDRISTRSRNCATRRGVSIGDLEGRIDIAYGRVAAKLRGRSGNLTRLVFPFNGVGFLLAQGQVTQIEVFRADALPSSQIATPTPASAALAQSAVVIASLNGRADGQAFIVTGSIANAGPPLAMFAEITLLGTSGIAVGGGQALPHPNPIGGGRAGSFEERLPVRDIVGSVVVTVRPMNRPTVTVAQATLEIKEFGQFAGLVEQLLEVTVLGATLDRIGGTIAAVTNRSALRIKNLSIEIKLQATCRVLLANGQSRQFIDERSGTIQVSTLAPEATVEVPINLENRGPCVGFGADWTATWRVLTISVEPEPKP